MAVVMEIADPSTYGLPGSSLWSCVEATVKENMNKVVYGREVGATIRAPIIGGEPMIRWMFLQVLIIPRRCPLAVDKQSTP